MRRALWMAVCLPVPGCGRSVGDRALLCAALCALGLTSPPPVAGQELSVAVRRDVLMAQALREPMVVEMADGTLFAAGYSRDPAEALDPPNLYRSDDGGESWVQVDVGTVEDGALGNSDVDLRVGPDGSLYFLAMGFDRTVGEGTHVALGISRDGGSSWSWRDVSRSRFDDRPWIGVTADGAHVVWNDGEGVRHAVSADRGETWVEVDRIADAGGSSHLAMGPAGEMAVRIAPGSASGSRVDPEADHVAVSRDGGRSWSLAPAPGERDWEEVPRWVEPLAWGEDGSLFSLWSEGSVLRIGRSRDDGRSWEIHDLVDGADPVYYPFLVRAPDGLLGLSWFSGLGDDLRARVGLVDPSSSPLAIRTTPALDVDAWRIRDGGRVRDPAGEYFPVLFLRNGDLGAVLPIQASERGDGFSWIRIHR